MVELLGIPSEKIAVLVSIYRQDARRLVMDLCNIDEPRILAEIARSVQEKTSANIATTLNKLCELGVVQVLSETKKRSKKSQSKKATLVINRYSMMPDWRGFFYRTAYSTLPSDESDSQPTDNKTSQLTDESDSQPTDKKPLLNMTNFGLLGYLLHINTSPLLRNCLQKLLADIPLYFSEILDHENSYLPKSQRNDVLAKQREWLELQIEKAKGIVDLEISKERLKNSTFDPL